MTPRHAMPWRASRRAPGAVLCTTASSTVAAAGKGGSTIICTDVGARRCVSPDLDAVGVLLPQTQWQRCGYADCRTYASAMHAGEADLNRCPPGGEVTLRCTSRFAATRRDCSR